jgi:hypothetical protein
MPENFRLLHWRECKKAIMGGISRSRRLGRGGCDQRRERHAGSTHRANAGDPCLKRLRATSRLVHTGYLSGTARSRSVDATPASSVLHCPKPSRYSKQRILSIWFIANMLEQANTADDLGCRSTPHVSFFRFPIRFACLSFAFSVHPCPHSMVTTGA